MKNRNKIMIGISILSILILFLLGLMVLLLKENKGFTMNFNFSTKISNHLALDQTYQNDFNQILIDQRAGDIEIKNSTNDQIRVVIYGKEDHVKMNLDDNLSISYQEDACKFFCIQKEQSKIEIYLPDSYQKEIKIKNQYGDTKVDSLKETKLNITADCGDIFLEDVNTASIQNSYGDIEIKKANKLEIKADCGDVKIGKVKDLEIENDYGDIEIGRVTNFLNIKEDCGDISIDNVEIQKDSTITNSYGDIEIETINDIYIDAKTSLGDVDIAVNNRKSNIILKIRNSCGDIEVGE